MKNQKIKRSKRSQEVAIGASYTLDDDGNLECVKIEVTDFEDRPLGTVWLERPFKDIKGQARKKCGDKIRVKRVKLNESK
jgi:hypothetical protein